MWRRVLIAAVVATAGLLAFVVALLRSPVGGSHVCALAEASLRDLARMPVSIGRCSVDPLGPRVDIERVVVGPPGRPVLSALRLSAGLSARSLLAGRVRLDHVEILRPHVDLDLSGLAGDSEVSRPRGASCLPDPGPVELGSFSLVAGDVSLALPGARVVRSKGVNLSVAGAGRRLRVTASLDRTVLSQLAQLAGQDAMEAAVDRTALRGELDLALGNAKVEALDIGAREGSVFAQAQISNVCIPRGTLTASAQVDLDELGATLLRRVPGLGGKASAHVRASVDGGRFEATADVQLRDGRVLTFGPQDVEASVDVNPERLELRSLELPLESGRAHATGTMQLREPMQTTVDATLRDFSLGDLLERLGVPGLPVHIVASGTGRLSGPLMGPRGPRLAGRLNLSVPAFGVYSRGWRERDRAVRFVGFTRGRLDGSFVLEKDRLSLGEAQVRAGETDLRARGTVWFDAHKGVALEVDSPAASLADIGPYAGAELLGRGSFSGTVEGPYRTMDIRGRASLREGSAAGVRLGSVAAAFRLDLGTGELDVHEASGARGHSTWTGRGHLSLHDDLPVRAHVDLDRARASDLVSAVSGILPWLQSVEQNADALLTGPVEASGPVTHPDVDANLALADVRTWGQGFDSGRVRVKVHGRTRADIPALELHRGDGTITATGGMTFDDLSFALQASTKGLHLRDVDSIAAARPELSGGVTAALRGTGTLADPHVRGSMTLRDMRLGDQPVATARLRFKLDGREVALRGTLASPWPRGSKPPARGKGEAHPLPPGSMFDRVRATARLEGNLPFTADIEADVPDARVVVPSLPPDLEASAGGTIRVQGELLRLGELKAVVELDRILARQGRIRVENSATAVAELDGGRVTLRTLPLRGWPSFSLDASGLREADGRIDLTAAGNADLSVLAELVPAIAESSGRADFDVALSGTADAPTIVGNARVEKVRVRPRDLPLELADASGSLTFSPDAVVLDGVEGTLNGAPVSLGGQLGLVKFRPGAFELRAELNEVPVPLDEDMPMVVSGTPTLAGTLDQMTLGGDVEISYFRFLRNLELERMIVQAIEVSRYRPPTPRVFERSGEFLTLDTGIHLGDVRVENNLLKADLRGDLRLTGTNRRPGIVGTVTVVDGKALVRNIEYTVTSGVVSFTDRNRIRPVFDLRADAKVREYDIHVNASGTPQQPRVLLSSEPSLPEGDIVTLLTLGVTARDFDRTDRSSLTGLALDAAYNASGLDNQIRRLLPQTDLLKGATFRVASAYSEVSGNIEPVAQFESRFLVDKLKLKAQTSLLGGRNKQAQAVYQFDDAVGAQLQWDSEKPSAPSFGDIGVDATVHKEWQ